MSTKRKTYSSDFKTKVVLEVLEVEQSIKEINMSCFQPMLKIVRLMMTLAKPDKFCKMIIIF